MSHRPTAESRAQVAAFAGMGMRHDDIGTYYDITAKTLRKHYRRELDVGTIKANMSIAKSLFNQAIGGNTSAAIFWLKARAGWREKEVEEVEDKEMVITVRRATGA